MKYFIGMLLIFIGTGLFAQDKFASSKIHELYDLLPKNCKESISYHDSFTCHANGSNLRIKVIRKNGKILHLGIDLFGKDNIGYFPDCIFHFVERYFLELLITEDMELFNKQSSDQKIVLMFNGQEVSKSKFGSVENIHLLLKRELQKKISCDSLNYKLLLSDGFNELKLIFPANNNIVSGMDKLELDKNLEMNLKSFISTDKATVVENSTKDFDQFHEYFISKGESYYKTITSSTYYRKVDNEYLLLYDKKYLAASLSNMFIMGHYIPQKQINIKHIQYGKETSIYSLYLNDFVNFFKQDKCKLYVGIEKENENSVQATLVVYNPLLNFVNIVYINTPINDLFDASQKINVKMYSNIPSDNIKDLYGIFTDDNSFQ